jgi:hypothetical protein
MSEDKLVSQKLPLTVQQLYVVRGRLDFSQKFRDLALFNLGIDSKLRGIDLVKLKVDDIVNGNTVQSRAMIIQQKNGQTEKVQSRPSFYSAIQSNSGSGYTRSETY